MDWRTGEDDAARRDVEEIVRQIDTSARVELREPGRSTVAASTRLVLVSHGAIVPFDVTAEEVRSTSSAIGRERLARRLGAALGLQPPDQMSAPPHG
ncbi:MAG: hypothetical protein U0821_01570 [Chloroflexota bacterium]